jgi:hypothetical protein
MAGKPDFKRKGRRRVDPAAVYAAVVREPWCRVCREPAGSSHHIIPRRHVDDSEDICVPVCGDGVSGCHGKVENHDEETCRKLGQRLRREEIKAVIEALGWRTAKAHLERRYFLSPDDSRYRELD